MEFFLNVAWLSLACLSVFLWLRYEKRTGAHRRLSLIALGVLLVILFPVISVTDDLWSMQNPAEADTCLRRSELASSGHSALSAPPVLPAFIVAEVVTENWILLAPARSPLPRSLNPARDPVENRPPPVA